MKKGVVVSICLVTALLLATSLIGQQVHKLKENPYNDMFATLSPSSVKSISLVVKHPVRETELSDSNLENVITLLNQIELGALDDPSYNKAIGLNRVYYPLHIELYDGTDIMLQINSEFFVIWPEAKAYYFTSINKRMEEPAAYPINFFGNPAYQEILDLVASLYEQYYPE